MGSPIGNALDRGGGYTMPQFRNHFDAHCGMEIVLPDGDLLRTGMGALPGAKTWQQYKSGFGPWIDGLFSQSNFGIVTKMGFWLMPEPEGYFRGTVLVPRHDDLIPLVQIMNRLENLRIYNGMPELGSPVRRIAILSETLAPDPELDAMLAKPGGPSDANLEAHVAKTGIGFWSCTLKFFGPPEIIQAQWAHAKKAFSAIPGASFRDGTLYTPPLTPEQQDHVRKPEFGIPSLDIFSFGARSDTNPTPSQGHQFFSPIIPRTGEAIFEANRVFAEAAQEFGIPFRFGMPGAVWERAFVFITGFPITHDVDTNRRKPRRLQASDPARRRAWLGRVPDPSRLLRRRDADLRLQRPRAAALSRADEGRGRSQRHHLGRAIRDLAEAPAPNKAAPSPRAGGWIAPAAVDRRPVRDNCRARERSVADGITTSNRPLVLLACMAAIFMAAIEGTIVATAMPTIVASVGGLLDVRLGVCGVPAAPGDHRADLWPPGRSLWP